MELLEPLINMGLNEKEARVYLALLHLNKATAYSVAIQSGLKRTTTYAVLDDLVSKGFALKIPEESKTLYLSRSPRECLAEVKEKIIEAEEALPKLLAVHKETEEEASVSYYEGMEQIQEVYKKLLNEVSGGEHFGFYGHLKDVPEVLKKFTKELDQIYLSKKIRRRIVITDTEATQEYIKNAGSVGVDIRAIPEELYNSNISIEMFGNKTLIFSHKNLKATLIENSEVTNVVRQIFEIAWKTKPEKENNNPAAYFA